jgi:hypothetical protein
MGLIGKEKEGGVAQGDFEIVGDSKRRKYKG